MAEWRLRSLRVSRALADKRSPARKSRKKEFDRVRIPMDFAQIRGTNPEEAARLQAEVRHEFEHWLGRGYAAVGLEDPRRKLNTC